LFFAYIANIGYLLILFRGAGAKSPIGSGCGEGWMSARFYLALVTVLMDA